ncbi:MAG: 4Fe-4S dicluster domain-containing protein [Oscillospiraceae bacterium]|nr:4Fe-4S dicluster domain-containing protein [Oscillospiraceae bacterium]
MFLEERESTHVYRQKRMFTKEELETRERLCVHEQPAFCNAACPLKLDAKAMLQAVAENDFKKALQLYEKITPFPHVLSAGCEAPCEGSCLLCRMGEGVAIRKLEQAVCAYGEKGRKGLPRMKKKKTVAIFGSGLFSLFLAGELQKKAYPVTVFCAENDLQHYFDAETGFVSARARESSLLALKGMDIQFRFQTDLGQLSSLREGFDVVCASWEAVKDCTDWEEALMYSRELKIVTGKTSGVLGAAFGAKKAALSVDRLAQNLDPSNTRGEEGTVETKLFVDLTDVKASNQCIGSGTREEAVAEAGRCIQCTCDACVKACAYLQHYKKYPRILTREIYNNVSIIMGDHMMNKPINACALCGQCSVVCPNGYDVGEICHIARQNMVTTGKMPLAPHEFALMDMLFSNHEAFLCRPQPGFEQCKYVFFPGCQAAAIAPDTVAAAYRDLCERLEGGVAIMLGCCGAICDWAGRYEMYDETKAFLDEQLKSLGSPVVIAGCPTCKKELSGHEGLVLTGIWDILTEIGLPESAKGLDTPAALHDSCGARGDRQTQDAIRGLAQRMGCTLVDTPYCADKSPCCGYGGLTQYTNREIARKMTQKCLERSELPYISYCMACRDRFAREGRESKHILELVYGTNAGSPPDISQKRYNRLSLKQELLRQIWNEETEEMDFGFNIEYSPEVTALMDDRMILKSDIIAVLQQLRQTGEAVLDGETGLCIARARLGNVTFWVKYQEIEGGYRVFGAYSHRMNVVRRQG